MDIIYAYLYNWGSSRAHLMSVLPSHRQRRLPRPCQTRPLTHTLLIVIRKQKHCKLDSCVRTLAKFNFAWFKYRVHIMKRHYFFLKSHFLNCVLLNTRSNVMSFLYLHTLQIYKLWFLWSAAIDHGCVLMRHPAHLTICTHMTLNYLHVVKICMQWYLHVNLN